MSNRIVKRSEIVADKIYKQCYENIDNLYIFRASKDLELYWCHFINLKGEIYRTDGWFEFESDNSASDKEIMAEATEEERMWFEYCELHNTYKPLEEALDYYNVKQFIQEHLTEE